MLIVGIGGTTRPGSSSETALRCVLDEAQAQGAEVRCFAAAQLQLPLYDPSSPERGVLATELIESVRAASGFVIASPGYHGTVSGLVKNALDYVEDTVHDERPYFEGRPVGCVAVAYGWQAAVNTLRTLRDTAHALRGWPTPYGAAINAKSGSIVEGDVVDEAIRGALCLVGRQVTGRIPAVA